MQFIFSKSNKQLMIIVSFVTKQLPISSLGSLRLYRVALKESCSHQGEHKANQ